MKITDAITTMYEMTRGRWTVALYVDNDSRIAITRESDGTYTVEMDRYKKALGHTAFKGFYARIIPEKTKGTVRADHVALRFFDNRNVEIGRLIVPVDGWET